MKKALVCLVVALVAVPSAAHAQSWTNLLPQYNQQPRVNLGDVYKPLTPNDILGAYQQAEQIKALRMQNEITRRQLQEMDEKRQAEATKPPEPSATPFPPPDAATLMFRARMAKAAETDPEILKIAADNTLPVSLPMALVIKDSEHPAQIIRYLDSDRAEASRIAHLDAVPAVHAMEAIEASLNTQKQK